MYTLPDKLKSLTPYVPQSGDYPIRLDANESFMPLPGDILKKIEAEISSAEFNRYPDPLCTKTVKAFGDYYKIDEKYVTAGNGSDELISIITNCFLSKGDKLAVLEPDFSMYAFYAHLAEIETVTLKKRADWTIDPDDVIEKVRAEQVRMLIFSNPCNPTSLGLDADKVRKIIENVDALVVLDEAYMDFYGPSLINEAHRYENLILLRTCSKMMGLAAARIGFAVANEIITGLLRAVKSPYNVNTLSAVAARFFLEDHVLIKARTTAICLSRDELYAGIKQMETEDFKVLKPSTNFVMIQTTRAREIFEALKEQGILVRQFENALRITAGSKPENQAVLTALKGCL